MKFKPGDLVWALTRGKWTAEGIPAGEHSATIKDVVPTSASSYRQCQVHGDETVYLIEIEDSKGLWCNHECRLRPRRDDYQQHEGLGSMDKINRPPDLNEAAIEEMCDFIRSAQKAHEHT